MSTEAMSSRERQLAAMRRQPVDRVPVKIWGAAPGFKTIHPSFDPILEAALDRSDIFDSWSMGFGIFGSATTEVTEHRETLPCEIQDYERHIRRYDTPAGVLETIDYHSPVGKPGYTKKHLIETVEDAERFLSIPYVPIREDTGPFFQKQEELGERGVVLAGFSEPMYSINHLTGSEVFAMWSVEQRDLLHTLIGEMYRRIHDRLEYQLQQGVGPVFGFVGPELCIPPLQSPTDFQEFCVAYNRKLCDLIHAHDGLVWCHCHGAVQELLDGFLEMEIDVLNPLEPPPMGDVDLAVTKAKVGHRICLEGNIEKGEFYTATTERMRELVREAIAAAAPGGGFILCPTSSFHEWSEASDTYVANYLAFLDEGLRAGVYPIRE